MTRYTTDELFSILEYSAKALGASDEEIYEFTRCVRPDGSVYGTRGKCRKGTQQDKPSSSLEQEMVRAGGHFQLPGKSKEESPVEAAARVARNKKSAEASKSLEKKRAEHEERVGKMAEALHKRGGGTVDDTLSSRNRVGDIKDSLNDISRSGREGATHIGNNDLEALLRHAENVVSAGRKAHVEGVVRGESERQKANRKAMIAEKKKSGASEGEISKAKSDDRFYSKRELERYANDAEREFNALFHLYRTSRKG